MKYIVRGILSLFLITVVFFSFLVMTAKTNRVLYEKPFLAAVNDFAVGDDSIYTLDSTYHTICKYDMNGNFVFAITYSSAGGSRIFVYDNHLHRYDYRSDKVYVYDENGKVLRSFDKEFSELVEEELLKYYEPKNIEYKGKSYNLQKRLILDSELTFDSTAIIVESVWYHIIVCHTVLLMILSFAFASYNIVRFCLNNYIENQKIQKNKDHRAF